MLSSVSLRYPAGHLQASVLFNPEDYGCGGPGSGDELSCLICRLSLQSAFGPSWHPPPCRIPCPCPSPWENHLSTELTTETILSLEYGRLGEAGISRTPECAPPPHSRTLTSLSHQASKPLDKEPHFCLSHLLPLLQVCTCRCKGDSPWEMTWH